MTIAYLNRVATSVPPNEVHRTFVAFAESMLEGTERALFARMARKSGIARRFSVLARAADRGAASLDGEGFYRREAFPRTAERMAFFEKHAPALAESAARRLDLGFAELARVTHLVVTTCTGAYAPGIDLELVARLGLSPSVERTMVGFMGCYAAVNALKLARHFVRSDPSARVLVVSVELCTLHLTEARDIESLLAFLLFGDGSAACLVTAEATGLALERFHAEVIAGSAELITWHVGDQGFRMHLGGGVPQAISGGLGEASQRVLDGASADTIRHWAVHPGGKSVLDAVERGLGLDAQALHLSRTVLAEHGNMSSATLLFVLERVLAEARRGERGCGMSFGPGLTAETFLFRKA